MYKAVQWQKVVAARANNGGFVVCCCTKTKNNNAVAVYIYFTPAEGMSVQIEVIIHVCSKKSNEENKQP